MEWGGSGGLQDAPAGPEAAAEEGAAAPGTISKQEEKAGILAAGAAEASRGSAAAAGWHSPVSGSGAPLAGAGGCTETLKEAAEGGGAGAAAVGPGPPAG